MNITDNFLKEIDTLLYTELEETIVEKMKSHFIDYLGVTLAGNEYYGEKTRVILQQNECREGIRPIGISSKISMNDAIFMNGLNAHALDFDDGCNMGIIHLGSPIFSALVPIAQKYNVSGKKFLKAAFIGYEVAFTLAITIQPKHKELGYHATGTCGTIGTALAIAYMLDYNREQIKNTFSTACVSASGMLKVLDDGSELKPYNVGKAALMGAISAQMGKAGFKGPDDVLGGERGFLALMTAKEITEMKHIKHEGKYAIERAYIKPYAACRYCHPAIEAAISLGKENLCHDNDIESIRVETYYWAVNKHDHTDVQGSASAKMSIPYGVAVGFLTGKAGLKEYGAEYVDKDSIKTLTKKVKVVSNDEFTTEFPQKTIAVVTIKSADKEYQKRVEFPKGEPENPLSMQEVEEKFFALSGMDSEKGKKLIDVVNHLETQMKDLYTYI